MGGLGWGGGPGAGVLADLPFQRQQLPALVDPIAQTAPVVDQGLVAPEAIDAIVRHYDEDVGPMNGARVVARAWLDRGYRERLLADGTAAIAELELGGPEGAKLVVVENTP